MPHGNLNPQSPQSIEYEAYGVWDFLFEPHAHVSHVLKIMNPIWCDDKILCASSIK